MTDARLTNSSTPTPAHRLARRRLRAFAATAAFLSAAVGGLAAAAPASAQTLSGERVAASATQGSPAVANPLSTLGDLLRERLLLADTVAQAKWIKGTPVSDPAREKVVIDDAVALATQKGVDTDLVRRVVSAQIAASKTVQNRLLTGWRHDPASAPTVAPDLTQVRTRLDAIDTALVDALGAVQHLSTDPGCQHLVDAERTREYPGLDGVHRKAVHVAWHGFCTPAQS